MSARVGLNEDDVLYTDRVLIYALPSYRVYKYIPVGVANYGSCTAKSNRLGNGQIDTDKITKVDLFNLLLFYTVIIH